MRKPLLECLLKGLSLDGEVLTFSPEQKSLTIQLKNVGDAPARNIRVRLYSNLPEDYRLYGDETPWYPLPSSDEPGYKYAFQSIIHHPIDPKESGTIDLLISNENAKSGSYQSVLKVFYE